MNYLFSSEAAIAKKILHDTGYVDESLTDLTDLSPYGISDRFSLQRPVYLATARNDHFTCQDLPGEQRDQLFIETLRNQFI